jgi:ribosomal protein S18 acetylase RimI-like enzyme
MAVTIVPLAETDFASALPLARAVVREGETYPLPRDLSDAGIRAYFFRPGTGVFKAECGGTVAGIFYLRANNEGPGRHVANAGFMVDPAFRGRGIARALALHAFASAKAAGFLAMQFNLVIASNAPAVHLWQAVGMKIVGTLPKVFDHPRLGLVDAYVMHKFL